MKSYHSLTDDLISMSKLTIQIVCFGDLFPSINHRVLNKMNVRTESCPSMGSSKSKCYVGSESGSTHLE
jgi:hypothetical protein